MYHCRQLETEQIEQVYQNCMTKDFPKNELKPLETIKKSIERGEYECYGIFSETEELCGYAYFVKLNIEGGKNYLLDYFATVESKRRQGIGTEFLHQLSWLINDAESIICEIENPDYAENPYDKELRERRAEFYHKCGFIDTNVTARVFGVEFRLLEMLRKEPHKKKFIRRAYSALYKSFLPKLYYYLFFRVHIFKKRRTEDDIYN